MPKVKHIALSTQDVGINLAILNFKNDQATGGDPRAGDTASGTEGGSMAWPARRTN